MFFQPLNGKTNKGVILTFTKMFTGNHCLEINDLVIPTFAV